MRRAVIDLGTNSALLLVADCERGKEIRIVEDRAEICRLGEGLHRDPHLLDGARHRTLEVLKTYQVICDRLQVEDVILVGTEACRRAHNTMAFSREIHTATGWTLQVLSPQEEALLSYAAAYKDFEDTFADPPLVMDPGGGSTEFIYCKCKQPAQAPAFVSIPIGSVVLTERFLAHDPPLHSEIEALRTTIDQELTTHFGDYPAYLKTRPVVALAGTATSLAAMDLALDPYDGERVQGYRLELAAIRRITATLLQLPLAERKKIKGLHPKRADVISSGALLVERALCFFGQDHMFVSDRGVRYGVLYRY